MKKKVIRIIKYPLLILFLLPFIIICIILPYNFASALGGMIGRRVGRLLKSRNKVAAKNLQVISPGITDDEMQSIIDKSWDNFGRIAAELISLRIRKKNYIKKIVDVRAIDIVNQATAQDKPIIFISAHYSNWEMNSLYQHILKLPLTVIYKKSPSKVINYLINFLRRSEDTSANNTSSIKQLINIVKSKKHLGMIVDQKVVDGITVPFFGIESTTSTLPANLAIRYDCIIIPVKVSRMKQRHKFQLEFFTPLTYNCNANDKEAIKKLTTLINQEFEKWIKKDPGEWFLCHRRWPMIGY